MAIALNRGNEVNIQRLTGGYGLTIEQIDQLTSIFNDEDWQKIQETWDIINSLWNSTKDRAGSDAVFYKINDFHQKKVEPTPFTTPTGLKLAGGYFPIVYDKELSTRVGEWTEKDDMMNSAEAMFPPANPKQSAMHARVTGNVTLPVKLDFNVLSTHINETIRYITHAQIINDAHRILKNETYKKSVEDAEGVPFYEMLRPAVSEIARPNSMTIEGTDEWVLKTASKSTAYMLAYNTSVALKQPYSIFGFWNDVGDGNPAKGIYWYGRGFAKVISNPYEAYQAMIEISPYMRTRSNNIDRDFQKKAQGVRGNRGAVGTASGVRDFMNFVLIKGMDFVTVFPSWHGAYQKSMKTSGGDMAKALRYADGSIRHSQPSSQPIDLNHLQRSKKGGHRFFTLFSTFTQKFGQRQRENWNKWINKEISTNEYVTRVAVEQIMPPLVMNLMFAALWGEDPDPEAIVADIIAYQFMGLFLIRDIVSAIRWGYTGRVGSITTPVLAGANLVVKSATAFIKTINDLEDDKKMDAAILAFVEYLSYELKFPIPKVVRKLKKGIEQHREGAPPTTILVPKRR